MSRMASRSLELFSRKNGSSWGNMRPNRSSRMTNRRGCCAGATVGMLEATAAAAAELRNVLRLRRLGRGRRRCPRGTPFCSERALRSAELGLIGADGKNFALSYQSASSHVSSSAPARRRARGRRAADCQSPSVKLSSTGVPRFRGRDKFSKDQRCVRSTALEPISCVSATSTTCQRPADTTTTCGREIISHSQMAAGDDDLGLTSGADRSGNDPEIISRPSTSVGGPCVDETRGSGGNRAVACRRASVVCIRSW